MKIKQLVSKGMWVLVLVLVGHGSNENRLRVWEKVDGLPHLKYINFLILSDKESVIVIPVINAHTLS